MSIASFQAVYGITTVPFAGGLSLPVFAGSSAASANGTSGFITNPYVLSQLIVPGPGGTLLVSGVTGTFGVPIISNTSIEGPARIYVAGGGATATGYILQKLGPGYSGSSLL